MSAAAFVLAINLFIAAIFATAFAVAARFERSGRGARWLVCAYGLGFLNIALEFALPYQDDHRPLSVAIFAVFLLALACFSVGLARHYQVRLPWQLLVGLIAVSLQINILSLDLPRSGLLRNVLYQGPYALMQLTALFVVLRSKERRWLDFGLLCLLALSVAHFAAKPFLAVIVGSGSSPQAYITTTYAAISQSLGTMILVTSGLLMLLIMVRDVMEEITAASETDKLSGVLNRRGFEDHADRALGTAARAGVPAVMLVADLDHFKQINDTFGHAAGDNVIAAFAQVLREGAGEQAVVGRLGGEEFAAFLPGANLFAGKLCAETVRSAFSVLPPEHTGIPQPATASLGVAQMMPGERLSELLRRADAALYKAKTDGRDRVHMAATDPVRHVANTDGKRDRRRR